MSQDAPISSISETEPIKSHHSKERGGTLQEIRGDIFASAGFSVLVLSHNLAVLLNRGNSYYSRDAQHDYLLGWLVGLLITTSFTYCVIRLYRRLPILRIPLTLVAIPASAFALYEFQLSVGLRLSPWVVASVPAVLLFIGEAWRARNFGRIPKILGSAFRFSAFLAVVCVWSAVWGVLHPIRVVSYDSATVPDAHAPIVWVIFDELDQGLLFDHRPPGIELPTFDALRKKAVSFSNAQRPGPETLFSLPALVIGKPVAGSVPVSEKDLRLSFNDGGSSLWSQTDSVFDSMKKLNRTSAIVGFYHNYGSVFAGKASHIRSEGYNFFGIPAAVEYQFWLFFPQPQRWETREKVGDLSLVIQAEVDQHKIYLARQLADTRKAITDWHCGFIFLHIGLPHAPWPKGTNDESHRGYLRNLVLTDSFLHEILLSLETAGDLDSSTIIVTSDHNLRLPLQGSQMNEKVPLMIKFPGQHDGLDISDNVDAVDLRWLIEQIAEGRVRTPQQAAEFLIDRCRG